MRALLTYITGDLRCRRLQAFIVILIVGLATGVGPVAMELLTESSAPFTSAFEHYQGAHLQLVFQGSRVSSEQLLATTRLPEVSASAGPWEISTLQLEYGTQKMSVTVVARTDPAGPVDRLRITTGRRHIGIIKALGFTPGQVVASPQQTTYRVLFPSYGT